MPRASAHSRALPRRGFRPRHPDVVVERKPPQDSVVTVCIQIPDTNASSFTMAKYQITLKSLAMAPRSAYLLGLIPGGTRVRPVPVKQDTPANDAEARARNGEALIDASHWRASIREYEPLDLAEAMRSYQRLHPEVQRMIVSFAPNSAFMLGLCEEEHPEGDYAQFDVPKSLQEAYFTYLLAKTVAETVCRHREV